MKNNAINARSTNIKEKLGDTPKPNNSTQMKPVDSKQSVKKRKPQQRGIDIRNKVVQAALELFGEHGFGGASTRAVAERVGITHTRVLYHFKTKDDLWIATLDFALSRYFSTINKNLHNDNQSAEKGLKIFVDQFVRLSAEVPQVHRIMTMEGNQDTERLSWLIDNYLKDHFAILKDLIMRGQAEGAVRDCDPARLYYFIIGGGGTPYTLSTEYKALTGRDVFSEQEILRNIAFLYDLIFV